MQTTLKLEREHIEALKRLADKLGLFQTRGAGAGSIPSVSAAVRCLAEMADNAEFIEVVKRLAESQE